MKLEKAIDFLKKHLKHYYSTIQRSKLNGSIKPHTPDVFLYPNILLVTETLNHFLFELIGMAKSFSGLTDIRQKYKSTEEYFDQFDSTNSDPALNIAKGNYYFENFCLSRITEYEILKERFPILNRIESSFRLNYPRGSGALIKFEKDSGVCLFQNLILINYEDNIYRVKYMRNLFVVGKNLHLTNFKTLVENEFNLSKPLKGIVNTSESTLEGYHIIGQFQNLYLSPKIRETTIAKFLDSHPEIIVNVLSAKSYIYEPLLEWIEKPVNIVEESINPDMFLERDDGYYDIIDFKTAALMRKNLTKGKTSRKRFIDYVYEGIAQLANYRDYFNYPKNAQLAFKKYNVKIKDPKLILIVGYSDNLKVKDILLAKRGHREVEIMDYDSLAQLFLHSLKLK